MEESYETFEEEFGPPRTDPPPHKPVRQIQRPEMYTKRRVIEEKSPIPQQPRAEPKTLPRQPSFSRTTSLQKALSTQNLSQIEKPWENVTLNRCLFVAITILVVTSGFQRLHETLRGRGTAEEEEEEGAGLRVQLRRSGTLRHRGEPLEPEKSLWEVLFWWLSDLDDEDNEDDDDEDDDGKGKTARSKRGAMVGASRVLRNKPLTDKKLLRQRDGKINRRTQASYDKIKNKKGKEKLEELDEDGDEEEEESKDSAPKKNKRVEEQKKKKTPRG